MNVGRLFHTAWIPVLATLVLLALMWAVSGALAQGPDGEGPPDAPSPVAAPRAPEGGPSETMAFTHQGLLKMDGHVVTGYYDFWIDLYDAVTLGSYVGHCDDVGTGSTFNTYVDHGLYTFYLICEGWNPDVFQGGNRWLDIYVRPSGGGAWTHLSPRQPVSPAPYAFSLYPGAVISYTTSGTELGDAILNISARHPSGMSDVYGLIAQSSSGSAVLGRSAGGIGLTGATETGYGVYGYDIGTQQARGYGGYFYSANGIGVYGESWGTRTHPNIYSPGVYGMSWNGVGVLGRSWEDSASWASAGVMGWGYANPGGQFYSYSGNIIEGWEDADGDGSPLYLRFKVTYGGEVYADGGYHCGKASGCWTTNDPADFAEILPAVDGPEPGDVLIIGPDGKLASSSAPFQSTVVGVYSTDPQYIGGGENLGQEGYVPLAVVGVVPVKASAENGPIVPGDLLTSSSTPGHAMRAGSDPPIGTVIGKALACS